MKMKEFKILIFLVFTLYIANTMWLIIKTSDILFRDIFYTIIFTIMNILVIYVFIKVLMLK